MCRRCHKNYLPILLNSHLSNNLIIGLDVCNRGYVSNVQNFFSQLGMFGPTRQEGVRGQDVILILEIAFHPLDVIILAPDLQLIRDEVAEFPPGNGL